jgi:hypothetical protein
MTDREVLLLTLKALGAVQEGGLEGQLTNIAALIKQLKLREAQVSNEKRVLWAQKTWDERIQQHEPGWAGHMSHCYGLDDDPYYADEQSRFACKYGQDSICPAALYKEPFEEYLRIMGITPKTQQ